MHLIQIWIDPKAKDLSNPWRAKLNGRTLVTTDVEPDTTVSYVGGTLQIVAGWKETQLPREYASLDAARLAVDQLLLQQQLDKSIQQQLKLLAK